MKRLILILFLAFIAFNFVPSAYAFTITKIGSGAQEDFAGGYGSYWDDYDIYLLQKLDFDPIEWLRITPPSPLYAVQWENPPSSGKWRSMDEDIDYFSIKAGNPNNGGGYILYQIADYSLWEWVEWTTAELGYKDISHIAWWGDNGNEPNPPPVPEPATVVLLGFGLIGMAAMRRKFKK